MKKLLVVAIAVVLASFAYAEGEQDFPTKDITNTVVFGAGGGTDLCNRTVSAEMAKALKVSIAVVNKPGGVAGSLGMLDVYSKPHDGYNLAGLSESSVTAAVQGGWDKKMDVWEPFIVGGSPDLISVTPDSPYKSIQELVAAAKANPSSIKSGASTAGSIHHLNLLAFEKGAGVKLQFIPYAGSGPAQNAAMTGEISLVITSIAEQAQLIRGGKLRPLAMLVPDDFMIADVGTIPSAFKTISGLSQYLPLAQAIGMAVPADTPEPIKAKLRAAFLTAMGTEPVQKWLKDNYYQSSGKVGKEAQAHFAKLESTFSWTLWELGAAKVDPATLNIPKP
ncbi:tripartite tricarboxylate transporter substrate binding protein [Treponema sp.]